MTTTGVESSERVLSTLNRDGSRRWLRPRPSRGRFLTARRIVAYALIAIFTLIPYLRVNGKPLVLLDVVHRRFTIFGFTFLPTDTLLLGLFLIGVFVLVFLLTALFGRVWCGWACPQTVYLEFIYRPIERFFEGEPGRKQSVGGASAGGRRLLKHGVYLLLSLFLAHTFLAYFVGVDALFLWVRRSPLDHPTSFIVMAAVTGLMLFDFGFFREQVCIVACPYGRFQSVMLDRNSLIVTYDPRRGEPRGRLRRPHAGAPADVSLKVVSEAPRGDCIDCHMCVTTCPTGIDIRDGLQMECIGCAQCIDACDTVMDKIGKPRGLIRFSSQSAVDGERRRFFRPRVVIYPAVLAVIAGLFAVVFAHKAPADVSLLRGAGMPFTVMQDGRVANQIRIKITNRTERATAYTLGVVGVPGASLVIDENPLAVPGGQSRTEPALVLASPELFAHGVRDVLIRVTDGGAFTKETSYRLLGPAGTGRASREEEEPHEE